MITLAAPGIVPAWVYEGLFPQADEDQLLLLAEAWSKQGDECKADGELVMRTFASLAGSWEGRDARAAAGRGRAITSLLLTTGEACVGLALGCAAASEAVRATKLAMNTVLASLATTTQGLIVAGAANPLLLPVAMVQIRAVQLAAFSILKAFEAALLARLSGLEFPATIQPRVKGMVPMSAGGGVRNLGGPGAGTGLFHTGDTSGISGLTGSDQHEQQQSGREQPSEESLQANSWFERNGSTFLNIVGGGGVEQDVQSTVDTGDLSTDVRIGDIFGTAEQGAANFVGPGPGEPTETQPSGLPTTEQATQALVDSAQSGFNTETQAQIDHQLDVARPTTTPPATGGPDVAVATPAATVPPPGTLPPGGGAAIAQPADVVRPGGPPGGDPPGRPEPPPNYPAPSKHAPAAGTGPTGPAGGYVPHTPPHQTYTPPAPPAGGQPGGGYAPAPSGGGGHYAPPSGGGGHYAPPGDAGGGYSHGSSGQGGSAPAGTGSAGTTAPTYQPHSPAQSWSGPGGGGPAGVAGAPAGGAPAGAPGAGGFGGGGFGGMVPPAGGGVPPVGGPAAGPGPNLTVGQNIGGGLSGPPGTPPPGTPPPGQPPQGQPPVGGPPTGQPPTGQPPGQQGPVVGGGIRPSVPGGQIPGPAPVPVPPGPQPESDRLHAVPLAGGVAAGAAAFGLTPLLGALHDLRLPIHPNRTLMQPTQFGVTDVPLAPLPPGMSAVFQKVLAPGEADAMLIGNVTTVRGLVYLRDQVAHLTTPEQLYIALGLGYTLVHPGGQETLAFDPSASSYEVLRCNGIRPADLVIPIDLDVQLHDRPFRAVVRDHARPWLGTGEAPGATGEHPIEEFELLGERSVAIPHLAEIWRMNGDGTESHVATFNARSGTWTNSTGEPVIIPGRRMDNGLFAITHDASGYETVTLTDTHSVLIAHGVAAPEEFLPAAGGSRRLVIPNTEIGALLGVTSLGTWHGARVQLLYRYGDSVLLDFADVSREQAMSLGFGRIAQGHWLSQWAPFTELTGVHEIERTYPVPVRAVHRPGGPIGH